MTTKLEFLPIFDRLCIAYSDRVVRLNASKEDKAAVMKVWFEILKDLDTNLLQAAALEYMSSPAAFPPTPGQVRGKAIELMKRGNKVPSAAEAWAEIQSAPIDGQTKTPEINLGADKDTYPWIILVKDYQFSHPLVDKVARNLGWPHKFWTDNLVSDRSKFMRYYEDELARATVEATSLPAVQEYVSQITSGQNDIKSITDGFKREALDRGER